MGEEGPHYGDPNFFKIKNDLTHLLGDIESTALYQNTRNKKRIPIMQ